MPTSALANGSVFAEIFRFRSIVSLGRCGHRPLRFIQSVTLCVGADAHIGPNGSGFGSCRRGDVGIAPYDSDNPTFFDMLKE